MTTTTMPKAIANDFKVLWNDGVNVHALWAINFRLFGTDKADVEVLNTTAPTLFAVVQRVLVDQIVLAIAVLTDPATQMKFKNLTLESLLSHLDGPKDTETREELSKQLASLREVTSPMRDHRNKRIAHSDYATRVRPMESSLIGISRSQFERSLKGIAKFLNRFATHFEEPFTAFEEADIRPGPDELMSLLRDAKEFRRARRARPGTR